MRPPRSAPSPALIDPAPRGVRRRTVFIANSPNPAPRPPVRVVSLRRGGLPSAGLEGLFFAPVVVNVRHQSIVDGQKLEDEGIAAASVWRDPVDADHECSLAAFNELVGAKPGVTGPSSRPLPLLFEDRPGLLRPLSARCSPPPEEAALDPAPDGVGCEQGDQRTGIAIVQSGVGGADLVEALGTHRFSSIAVPTPSTANRAQLALRRSRRRRGRRRPSQAA